MCNDIVGVFRADKAADYAGKHFKVEQSLM